MSTLGIVPNQDKVGQAQSAMERKQAPRRTPIAASDQSEQKRRELADVQDVQRKRDQLVTHATGWPGEPGPPRPFVEAQRPPFPESVLPPVLLEFAQAVAAFSQVPLSMPGMLGLGMLSAAWAGKVVAVLPNGHSEQLSLYCVAAADVGERKSSTFAQFQKPIQDFQRERKEQLAPLRSEHEAEHAGLKAEHERSIHDRGRAKTGSPEHADACDRAKRLREQLDKLQPPPDGQFVTRDTTAEGLAKLMSKTGGFALLLSPEGGGVIDRMAGHYDREPNIDVFLKAYDGESIGSHRASAEREISEVKRPALAIVVTTQPATLQKLTERHELEDRGLVARLLFALPSDSKIGSRTPNSPPIPPAASSNYCDAMLRCLRIERPDEPHRLNLSSEAIAEHERLHWQIEPQLARGGSLYDMRGWAGKLVGKIIRIAALSHLWEQTIQQNAAPWEIPISGDTFRRAAELAPWFIEHARAAFSQMTQSPKVKRAQKLLDEWRTLGTESITTREALRLIDRNGTKADALEVLEFLAVHNYVASVPSARKDSQQWRIHPDVATSWKEGTQNAE